jgi:hypothetical protein
MRSEDFAAALGGAELQRKLTELERPAPLLSAKSLISPRSLASARQKPVPAEAAPVPPALGSIIKLPSRPLHPAPVAPPLAMPAVVSSAITPRGSPSLPPRQLSPGVPASPSLPPRSPRRRHRERNTSSSQGSQVSHQTLSPRATLSLPSPRSPRSLSPRGARSPRARSPRARSPRSRTRRSSRSHQRSPSPPQSPRLTPDEYHDALSDLRVALRELAVRHEVEVGEVRAERDALRVRVAELEAQAARYRERLRALGAPDDAAVAVAAVDSSGANAHANSRVVVRTRSRADKPSLTTGKSANKSVRPSAPDYHVSTSSSSAEKQILQLRQQPVTRLPSAGSDDGSSRAPKSNNGSRSEKRVSRPSKSSTSSSSGPPVAELLALASKRTADKRPARPAKPSPSSSSSSGPPVSELLAMSSARDEKKTSSGRQRESSGSDSSDDGIVFHGASSAVTSKVGGDAGTGTRADTYSSNTFGSVHIVNAEDVVHVRDSQSSDSSSSHQLVHPVEIEIVELETRSVREVQLLDDDDE